MSYGTDDIELVKRAQLGDGDSLNRLAEVARVRLHEYVLRLTLSEDLAQDIVQETILEMLRIFSKLRRAEAFWGWLYGIAFNKVRNHYGKRWRRRTHNFSEAGYQGGEAPGEGTLAEVVTEELKQIVMRSMAQLAPRHRAVLTMRCYDHLSYREIAKLMGCTEMGARAIFCRAKKALARRLSDHGLEKGSLLLALIAFGKMTATSKASAAQVAVTGATLQVGSVATLLATATGRPGLIVMAVAGTLAVGSATLDSEKTPSALATGRSAAATLPATPWQIGPAQKQECWYYFPDGAGEPLMLRLLQSDVTGKNPVCHILQNQYANYHFDPGANTIRITNHRAWKPDLAVTRLPTDSAELSDFIARTEGRETDMERTRSSRRRGLLVICNRDSEGGGRIWRIDRHVNVLDEEYFQVSWPESTPVVDDRDAMHRRGWTYFQVGGHLGDRVVSGAGRVPFVYAAASEHSPWLKVRLGREATLVDTPTGASLYDEQGHMAGRLAGGSFWKGLARPWMGLHCLDTIRRDAAEARLPFETEYDHEAGRASVTVHTEEIMLVYTVDMASDLVETIHFFRNAAGEAERLGELGFVYLQDVPQTTDPLFATPADIRFGPVRRQKSGMRWLARLATGRLHD